MAFAHQIINQIEQDPCWKWAANPENVGMLRDSLFRLKSSLSPFGSNFLVFDIEVMRKKTPERMSWRSSRNGGKRQTNCNIG